ncbi:hypothetical protein D9M71_230660 [compost metagenome]
MRPGAHCSRTLEGASGCRATRSTSSGLSASVTVSATHWPWPTPWRREGCILPWCSTGVMRLSVSRCSSTCARLGSIPCLTMLKCWLCPLQSRTASNVIGGCTSTQASVSTCWGWQASMCRGWACRFWGSPRCKWWMMSTRATLTGSWVIAKARWNMHSAWL